MQTDVHYPYTAMVRNEQAVGVAREEHPDPASAESELRPYTSRIIKAGALLADTQTLLDNWDQSQSQADNLSRLQRENIFGKASRARIRDIQAIFRQRYL